MALDKPKTTFNNYTAYNLKAEPVDGTKMSRLLFSDRNGFPRITVFYGNENKNIYAPMDIASMLILLDDIIAITNEPNDTKRAVTCRHLRRDNYDPKISEIYDVSTIMYGKDSEGVIWISLIDRVKPESPKIQFKFTFSDYISLIGNDGQEISDKGKLSQILARARCTALKDIFIRASVGVNLTYAQQTTSEIPQATKKETVESFDFDI